MKKWNTISGEIESKQSDTVLRNHDAIVTQQTNEMKIKNLINIWQPLNNKYTIYVVRSDETHQTFHLRIGRNQVPNTNSQPATTTTKQQNSPIVQKVKYQNNDRSIAYDSAHIYSFTHFAYCFSISISLRVCVDESSPHFRVTNIAPTTIHLSAQIVNLFKQSDAYSTFHFRCLLSREIVCIANANVRALVRISPAAHLHTYIILMAIMNFSK